MEKPLTPRLALSLIAALAQTPTILALRDRRYKYIYYHGVWDTNELYDLEADPQERRNLVAVAAHAERVAEMRGRLFDRLRETDGMRILLRRPTGYQAAERR